MFLCNCIIGVGIGFSSDGYIFFSAYEMLPFQINPPLKKSNKKELGLHVDQIVSSQVGST